MQPSNFILRPSAAATWVKCHGMPSLAQGMPEWIDDDEDVEVREEGTACHWAAHQWSITGQPVAIGTVAPNGVQITEEMHDACVMYFDAVREWGVSSAYFEQPVKCKRIHLTQCEGTLDVGAYCPVRRTLFIGDLKFGYRFVDAVENWQLICYYTGLEHACGFETDLDHWVEFLIVQPRSYHRDGPVRRWRVHASELRAHVNILANAAERALGANPVCAVNNGCGRCAGRSRCETLQAAAAGWAESSHSATPHDLPFVAAEDELRRLQHARDVLDARITGLETEVLYGIRKGGASRHFAIEQSTGRRIWSSPQAEATIVNIGKLLGVEVTITKPITPAQAERKIPAAFIAQNSHRPAGAMKLVPIESSTVGRKLRTHTK